jgi:ribose 5-phosphate isomerase A
MERKALKELVGRAAVDALVRDGMKLGLGTGSTAMPAVARIGELLGSGALRGIKAVPTSFQTQIECERWGIPLFSLNSPEIAGELDLTIDGADEIDPGNRLIKGGGGALLLEKIVAYNSRTFAIVADGSKLVEHLGLAFPVPIEIIPDARVPLTRALVAYDAEVVLRSAVRKAGPVVTDRGNLLLDVRFRSPVDPAALEAAISLLPGVVETGFFTRKRPIVYVAGDDGKVQIRE